MRMQHRDLELFTWRILQCLGVSSNPLATGATLPQVEAHERLVGYPLPPALRSLYLMHNGELDPVKGNAGGQGIFCGYIFRSLQFAELEYGNWIDAQEAMGDFRFDRPQGIPSVPEGAVLGNYVRRGWVPFAGGYGGAQLAIDFMPGRNGNVGQVITFGRDDYVHFRLAASFDDFLELLLRKYESREWHPVFKGDSWSLYDQLVDEAGLR